MLSKVLDIKVGILPVQLNHVHRIPALVSHEVIRRYDLDSRASSCVDRIRQISSMRQVMHSHIEPHYEVLLLQVIAVEKFIKVDHRIVDILDIEWI